MASFSENTPENHLGKKPGRSQVTDLKILVENGLISSGGKLLPTPQAHDAIGGKTPEQVQAMRERGRAKGKAPGVSNLNEVIPQLLKTPTAQLAVNGGSQDPAKRRAGGHGPTLADQVEYELLPTPTKADGERGSLVYYRRGLNLTLKGAALQVTGSQGIVDWGPYARAVLRWQQVTGRMVPSPTELSPKGNHVLSPRFVEWMMGLDDGWVTQVPGLPRAAQLKILGNGVVRQQAVLALSILFRRPK